MLFQNFYHDQRRSKSLNRKILIGQNAIYRCLICLNEFLNTLQLSSLRSKMKRTLIILILSVYLELEVQQLSQTTQMSQLSSEM